MRDDRRWSIIEGEGPLIAVANHAGHGLRAELGALTALDDAERLREEDPFTDEWTSVAPTRVTVSLSRFEVDLNRSRDEAFYRSPQDAWGLNLWKSMPSAEVVQRSLDVYDAFYHDLYRVCAAKAERHGRFVVLDLHSYNHRRDGAHKPAADAAGNPEVNVGTGTMVRERWAALIDRFMADLASYDTAGRGLDVRENVKFVGRGFPKWVHTTFPDTGCALAVEFKKVFMDEWSGSLDREFHGAIREALGSTVPGLLETLGQLGGRT